MNIGDATRILTDITSQNHITVMGLFCKEEDGGKKTTLVCLCPPHYNLTKEVFEEIRPDLDYNWKVNKIVAAYGEREVTIIITRDIKFIDKIKDTFECLFNVEAKK